MYYNMKCDSSKIGKGLKTFGIILMVIGVIFLIMGFDKYIINPYSYRNMYVGGDAYNYIINASRSTALFVVSGVFELVGIGFNVMSYLAKLVHINNLEEEEKENN